MRPRHSPLIARCLITLVVWGCTTFSSPIDPRTLSFRRFSVVNGLSQSTVTAIAQDHQGFLWFATQDGLNKFDGYGFTVFSHREGDSTTIPDNYVTNLLITRNGDLWIGTYNQGLGCFRGSLEYSFTVTPDVTPSIRNAANSIYALCEDRDGSVLAGTWGAGLMRVEGAPSGWRVAQTFVARANTKNLFPDNRISALLRDSEGNLWIGTWGGLSRVHVNAGSDTVVTYYKSGLPGAPGGDRIWCLLEDRNGAVWVGSIGGGLARYEKEKDGFVQFRHNERDEGSLADDNVTALLEGADGTLWVGTQGAGLDILLPGSAKFLHLRRDPTDPEGLSDDGIRSLCVDRGGAVWIGTAGAGAFQCDPKREKFPHFKHSAHDPASLSHDLVRAICQDGRGRLWIGTRGGGVNCLVQGARGFVSYRHRAGDSHSLSSDNVLALAVRKSGEVWVGTQDKGIDRIRPDGTVTGRFRADGRPGSLAHNGVISLLEDREGRMWVGTVGGGLDQYDDRTGAFIHHESGRDPAAITGNWVWSLYEDRRDNLWVGTWGMGLNRFDRKKNAFVHYVHDPAEPSSLSNNTILCITEDEEGSLWIGTEGGGLERLDVASGRFSHLTEKQGLPNNVVYAVVPDRQGNLWLSTNRGIVRYVARTGEIRSFDISDGLQSNEFNQGAYCRLADGRIALGGVGGFNLFDPAKVADNPTPPPVVITRFTVNQTALTLPTMGGEETVLEPEENVVAFEFAALDFTAPEKNQYAYHLDGFDPDWVQAGTRRYVNYTKLDPGSYVFRVTGSNNDGVWNTASTTLQFKILPPFWRTPWFISLAVLLAAGMLYALYRYRVSHMLAIERIRLRIASDLHDDIGSTLTKIAVHSEVIQGTDDPEKIRSLSKQIGAASREVIRELSDIVWSIDARHDTLGNLADRMRDFATEVLTPRHVAVHYEMANTDPGKVLPVEVRQTFYLIFKEAVNNVLRHSDARNVTVTLSAGAGLTMSVADDGTGSGKPVHETGHGLRNMRMRAERVGADLRIEAAQGVRVELRMAAL